MATLVATPAPPLQYDADGDYRLRLSVTLPEGRALTDYELTRCTIREDPRYPKPRSTTSASPDPIAEGWEIKATADGSIVSGMLAFDITMPAEPGERRYMIDIIGDGVATGFVRLYPSTWVDIKPGVTARPE